MDPVMLQFVAAPFAASLILAGIHTYLGIHVVERGVIFVDLSLAQIAAFGATIAVLMPMSGGDPHAPAVYWISLGFTFLGAAVFSVVRGEHAKIPQEAIIGIVLRGGVGSHDSSAQQGDLSSGASPGHARRQYSLGLLARGRHARTLVQRSRSIPLHLPR